jgi:hypothetical protein
VSYQEPLLLFHNTGKGLENVSSSAGPAFAASQTYDPISAFFDFF